MKNKKVIFYMPSYCLLYDDPSKLTPMSLRTTEEAIDLARKIIMNTKGQPILIFSSAYPDLWKEEAKIKKKMALDGGLKDDSVIIIPEVTDSYDEAKKIKELLNRIVNPNDNVYFIVVAEKWHASRAAKALRLSGIEVNEVRRVRTKIERALEPSWIKSIRSSNIILYILWQWIFYIATPWMMRRQMRKGGR